MLGWVLKADHVQKALSGTLIDSRKCVGQKDDSLLKARYWYCSSCYAR